MRTTWLLRVISTLAIATALVATTGIATPDVAAAATEQTICFDGALARTRTEIDADMTVPQFDASLGTLLAVTVNGPSVHLDTDAVFESTAGSAVTFAERMDYLLALTSPGGLVSPAPIAGFILRIPTQTLAAFDGTLDFLGVSAVSQPSTARDEVAPGVTSSDATVLAAFTGAGTMPFHLTTTISETFMGGGGNVQFQINTFAAASVQVCYRYGLPTVVVDTATPPAAPPTPEPPVVEAAAVKAPARAPQLPLTGSTSAPLAILGAVAITVGAVLAWRWRPPRPRFDV